MPPILANDETIRVATYNTSLFRDADGQLIADLESGDNDQARKIAEVIQRVRPDMLFLNEFDYDEAGRAAELFRTKYLGVSQNGSNRFNSSIRSAAPSTPASPAAAI